MYTQLEQRSMAEPPVNVSTLRKMKQDGEAIACVTAYDASFAALVDAAADGQDHDEDPVRVRGDLTGRDINLAAFSRLREKTNTTNSVLG